MLKTIWCWYYSGSSFAYNSICSFAYFLQYLGGCWWGIIEGLSSVGLNNIHYYSMCCNYWPSPGGQLGKCVKVNKMSHVWQYYVIHVTCHWNWPCVICMAHVVLHNCTWLYCNELLDLSWSHKNYGKCLHDTGYGHKMSCRCWNYSNVNCCWFVAGCRFWRTRHSA